MEEMAQVSPIGHGMDMSDPRDRTPSPETEDPSPGVPTSVSRALEGMRDHLTQLERLYQSEVGHAGSRVKPIWLEATEGEHRLPVALAAAIAIALQVTLPNRLTIHPTWLFPALDVALLLGLVAANPKKIDRESHVLRMASLVLIAAMSIDNIWSAGHLIQGLLNNTMGSDAGPLFTSGGSIYLTNIIVFGLWYWEFDRGGPVARLRGSDPYPDFLFPQMNSGELAPPGWAPTFVDYMYVSITNATAFSPTDTMPLTRGAKALMAVQAGVSLSIGALVVARAVNILH